MVACARGNVIGKDNTLPWHLPEDLKYFKKVTTGKCIIMGRKTFQSIGRALPNRTNIVISKSDWEAPEDVVKVANITRAIGRAKWEEFTGEAIIIGGGEIYRQFLSLVSRVYKTEVDVEVEGGDTFFPELPEGEWKESLCILGDENASIPHEFKIYDRVSNF